MFSGLKCCVGAGYRLVSHSAYRITTSQKRELNALTTKRTSITGIRVSRPPPPEFTNAQTGKLEMSIIRKLLSVILPAIVTLIGANVYDSRAETLDTAVTTIGEIDGDIVRTITIHSYTPPQIRGEGPSGRCLVVIHGKGRGAESYLKTWKPIAKKYAAFLIAPEFAENSWPKSRHFNWGNVLDNNKRLNPPDVWGFTLVERGIDKASDIAGQTCRQFFLYGHSAGAQFVHRYVMFTGGHRIVRAVAANAGYYLWPDRARNYPYGLKRLEQLALPWQKVFESRLVVMIGSDDIDASHKDLRQTKGVTFQGSTRLHRGLNFFRAARIFADDLAVPFYWRLETAPGVGHSNRRIAPFAAYALFER